MWPWEHLAFGYVLFSLLVRASGHRPPSDASAYLLAFSTQLPDLVDKPLAWEFGILRSGLSVGHSVFVALAVSTVAVAYGRLRRRTAAGLAVAVGYLSHLLGDVLYPLAAGKSLRVSGILWPLVENPPVRGPGVLSRVRYLLANLEAVLAGPTGALYVGLEVALIAAAVALWYADGCPGTRPIAALLGRPRSRGSDSSGR